MDKLIGARVQYVHTILMMKCASHALYAYHSHVKTEVYFGLTAEGKEQIWLLTFVWNDPTNSVPYPAVSLKGTKMTVGTSPEWDL